MVHGLPLAPNQASRCLAVRTNLESLPFECQSHSSPPHRQESRASHTTLSHLLSSSSSSPLLSFILSSSSGTLSSARHTEVSEWVDRTELVNVSAPAHSTLLQRDRVGRQPSIGELTSSSRTAGSGPKLPSSDILHFSSSIALRKVFSISPGCWPSEPLVPTKLDPKPHSHRLIPTTETYTTAKISQRKRAIDRWVTQKNVSCISFCLYIPQQRANKGLWRRRACFIPHAKHLLAVGTISMVTYLECTRAFALEVPPPFIGGFSHQLNTSRQAIQTVNGPQLLLTAIRELHIVDARIVHRLPLW